MQFAQWKYFCDKLTQRVGKYTDQDSYTMGAGKNYVAEFHAGRPGLEKIEGEWHEIGSRISSPAFYHLYGWYWSYTKNLERDGENLSFVLIREDDTPVCIVPVKEYKRKFFGLSLRSLETPDHDHMGLSDIIAADGTDISSVVEHLRNYSGMGSSYRPDVFRVKENAENSGLGRFIKQQPMATAFATQVGRSKYIDCTIPFPAYQSKLTGRFRKNNRRKRRNAEKLGDLKVNIFPGKNAFPEHFREFLELEASGWKGDKGKGTAIKFHGEISEFYKDLNACLDGEARCGINTMALDGKCIAAQFYVICGRTLYLLKIAFNEELSSISPGFLLLDELIKHSCESRDIDRVSFVTGAKWNDDWKPETLKVSDTLIINRTTRGLIVCTLYRLKNIVKAILSGRSLETESKQLAHDN